jgi:endonuclease/exonuclease/phosphatase family metal-dependent hydrolase
MVKVLTYNVSWQSMTGNKTNWILCNNKNDESNNRHFTKCIRNIANLIDTNGYGLDFIALQEASNYKILIDMSETLKNMKYLVAKSGLEEVITFWNPEKYCLKKYYNGEFKKGRIYQVLLFNNDIIFINIHSEHYKYDVLIKKLDKILEDIFNFNKSDKLNILKHKYRIVIAGDFNNEIEKKINLNNINFYTHDNLNTCCYNTFLYKFDHVIDSKAKPLYAKIPKVNKLTSDHLPLLVELID